MGFSDNIEEIHHILVYIFCDTAVHRDGGHMAFQHRLDLAKQSGCVTVHCIDSTEVLG